MTFHDLNGIYVDAGCFVIGDKDWFISKGADPKLMEDKDHQFIIKCEPGKHTVHYILPHSWDGYKSGAKNLNITSGELWVTDACYVIHEDLWDEFLADGCLDKSDDGHFTIDTSGDGGFDLELIIE